MNYNIGGGVAALVMVGSLIGVALFSNSDTVEQPTNDDSTINVSINDALRDVASRIEVDGLDVTPAELLISRNCFNRASQDEVDACENKYGDAQENLCAVAKQRSNSKLKARVEEDFIKFVEGEMIYPGRYPMSAMKDIERAEREVRAFCIR